MKRLFLLIITIYLVISFVGMEANPVKWTAITRAIFSFAIAAGFLIQALAPKKAKRR